MLNSHLLIHRRSLLAGALALVSFLGAPLHAAGLSLSPAEEQRVDKLLASLSLDEKLGQLTQYGYETPAWVSAAAKGEGASFLNIIGADKVNAVQAQALKARAKIPLLFGLDVIHGYRTEFPIPLAEACSWDPALAEKTAAVAALEAYADGIRWTFAPMVDIARDPRWGRVMEGAGEDPTLGSAFAAARVRGFQKDRLLVACVKHFVGYGAAEAGRDYNTTEISERRLWETYYPPFQAGIEAGAGTMMSSFNALNGVPLADDPKGMRNLFKDRWGFNGLIVSDWGSVSELIVHGVAADKRDAALKGFMSGVDMDMAGENYSAHLKELVQKKEIPAALIDDAARRVLRVKMWLGLFDKPMVDPALGPKVWVSKEHRAVAREAALASCVLLKNEKVLPLSPELKRVAVIGPLAASKKDQLGNWSAAGKEADVVSILEGIQARLGAAKVDHVKGCEVLGDDRSGFKAALAAAKKADAVVLVLGESWDMSGEAYSRTQLGLPGVQRELAEAVLAAGKPTVLVLANGRPLAIDWEAKNIPAILETWFLGVEAGPAVAALLFGDATPQGKLAITFPRSVGQVPIYHSVLSGGRPETKEKWTSKYIDSPNSPLYAFGHGLSYTRFEYSGLRASSAPAGSDIKVDVTVTNAGGRDGVEVAQLYVRDPLASVSRPVKELKGFAKLTLKAGESRQLSFNLSPAELGYYDRDLQFGYDPGRFDIWVSGDSASGLSVSAQVEGKPGFIRLPGQRPGLARVAMAGAAAPAAPTVKAEPKPEPKVEAAPKAKAAAPEPPVLDLPEPPAFESDQPAPTGPTK